VSYQDQWVRGTIAGGERECASRYAAIKVELNRYRRRITMLDLGASEGYFSFRAVADFAAVAVMIEGGPQLLQLCEANALPGTILLQQRVSVEGLEALADCEHFDVVLALNVLHHFPDAARAVEAVMRLGDVTIIETPPPGDVGACGQSVIPELHQDLLDRGGREIARTPSHTADIDRPMWVFETPKTTLRRAYFDAWVPLNPMRIGASHSAKWVEFPGKDEHRPWIHGINLQTYRLLGGVWPAAENVAEMVRRTDLPDEAHGDIRPWNFILDGTDVHLIDGRDERAIYDDAEGLAFTVDALGVGAA